jgi:hypothetical protein
VAKARSVVDSQGCGIINEISAVIEATIKQMSAFDALESSIPLAVLLNEIGGEIMASTGDPKSQTAGRLRSGGGGSARHHARMHRGTKIM